MSNAVVGKVRALAAVLSVGVLASLSGAAHAGLVSGRWDPQFGPALPNLSWQARTHWQVPNECSDNDGVFSTGSAPCDGTQLLAVWIRWFNTAAPDPGDPSDFFQHVFPNSAHYGLCLTGYADPGCSEPNVFTFLPAFAPLFASDVRIVAGQVVGFNTGGMDIQTNGWPDSAGLHTFNLSFTTNGPIFTCRNTLTGDYATPETDPSCDEPVTARTADLNQFLVTYVSDNTSTPKFRDANGNPLGAVLDGNGNYLGQRAIPEPGGLLLAAAALAALGAVRRRRA